MQVDLGTLSLAEGGYLLIKRALRRAKPAEEVVVIGAAPGLDVDLRAWCRIEGHQFDSRPGGPDTLARAVILSGHVDDSRWTGARRAGDPSAADAVAEHASPSWGLAARGAMVELGAPEF